MIQGPDVNPNPLGSTGRCEFKAASFGASTPVPRLPAPPRRMPSKTLNTRRAVFTQLGQDVCFRLDSQKTLGRALPVAPRAFKVDLGGISGGEGLTADQRARVDLIEQHVAFRRPCGERLVGLDFRLHDPARTNEPQVL